MKILVLCTVAMAVCLAEPPVNNRYLPPQQGFGGSAPSQTYGAPGVSSFSGQRQTDAVFGARPSSSYGAPSSRSNRPSSQYGAPRSNSQSLSNQYLPAARNPSSQYGAPRSSNFQAPPAQYGAPSSNNFQARSSNNFQAPSSQYGAPSSNNFQARSSNNFQVPSSQYGAPSSNNFQAPSSQYGAPSSNNFQARSSNNFQVPFSQYGAPSSNNFQAPSSNNRASAAQSLQAPSSQYGVPQSFQGSNDFSASFGQPSAQYGAPNAGRSGPSTQYGAPEFGGNQQYSQNGQGGSNFRGTDRSYLPPGRGGYAGAGGNDDANSEPANYSFEYMVKDEPSGNDFGHRETRQGDRAEGLYYVLLPDGRKQTVEYEADENGYKPRISYEDTGLGSSNADYDRNEQSGYQDYQSQGY